MYLQHTKNIHNYKLRKRVYWDEICVFSENRGNLEVKKNSVIDGQIFII